MNKILFCMTILLSMSAQATPRMDVGVGDSNNYLATVIPDSVDSNLYYVFPQSSSVSIKKDGTEDFTYVENRKYGYFKYSVLSAQLNIGVSVSLDSPLLKAKLSEIKARNPNAVFTVITAYKTEMVGLNANIDYFLSSDCGRVSGPLEVPVYCTINIRPELSFGFRKLIKNTQARVFNLIYHFYGSVSGVVNSYSFSVPILIGSLSGEQYFVDQFGVPLP